MKTLLLLAASALALGACTPKTNPPQRAALDCPASQGKLARTGKAADGKSCTYRGDGGAEITLQFVSVTSGVDDALKTVEDGLVTPSTPAAAEAAAVEAQAGADADPDYDDHDGDRVDIDIPGVRISASDDKADINIAGMTVKAGEDGAVIRKREDVRLKGEALSREKRGVRASFFRADKRLPDGWRYVGYEAAGPQTGPLAVALVRSRSDGDTVVVGLDNDLKRLVRRNGGV